jgi:UDP-N-acetylglucosamine 2-epimerase (non-hydrolysing)
MKIVLVAGARPNFMKIAAIIHALDNYNASHNPPIKYTLVHTGQHYDHQMSDTFFADLGMPKPDVALGVGSGSHAQQTADVMKRFEMVVTETQPHVVLVVGDVNSSIACALVAAKIVYNGKPLRRSPARPFLAHVEAGLRSHDRTMPEEINRIVTDALSDFLFTTEEDANHNLRLEGIPDRKIFFVGNTMVDTLVKHRQKALASTILKDLGLKREEGPRQGDFPPSESERTRQGYRPYGVVTLHRPGNVDHLKTAKAILKALKAIAQDMPIVFPIHPRTLTRLHEFGLQSFFANPLGQDIGNIGATGLYALKPLSYLDFLCVTANSRLILTDSGGIQEEAMILGIPCVTLRENTERPITLQGGNNVLAGIHTQNILLHARRQLQAGRKPGEAKFWDGKAGKRIVTVLSQWGRKQKFL